MNPLIQCYKVVPLLWLTLCQMASRRWSLPYVHHCRNSADMMAWNICSKSFHAGRILLRIRLQCFCNTEAPRCSANITRPTTGHIYSNFIVTARRCNIKPLWWFITSVCVASMEPPCYGIVALLVCILKIASAPTSIDTSTDAYKGSRECKDTINLW